MRSPRWRIPYVAPSGGTLDRSSPPNEKTLIRIPTGIRHKVRSVTNAGTRTEAVVLLRSAEVFDGAAVGVTMCEKPHPRHSNQKLTPKTQSDEGAGSIETPLTRAQEPAGGSSLRDTSDRSYRAAKYVCVRARRLQCEICVVYGPVWRLCLCLRSSKPSQLTSLDLS
jgi:hypothetical protein